MAPLVVLDVGVWSARCGCGWSSLRCATAADAQAAADTHRCRPVLARAGRRRAALLV